MDKRLSGRVIVGKEVQSWKAYAPIEVTSLPMTTPDKEEHSKKV